MEYKGFNDWKAQRIRWWHSSDYRALEAIATALELWNKPHLAKLVRKQMILNAYTYMHIICALMIGICIGVWGTEARAQVVKWEDSPQNWKNNSQNYDNSSQKWDNSPQNWNNNPNNYNSNNGVYDNSGRRTGYETMSPDGVRNYYDNNGNRQGYKPYGR